VTPQLRKLGATELRIAPLVLGGNVFGWTADREASFAVLDAFLDAGFNAIDTADWYTRSVPGHQGGESEAILGEWMQDRRVRHRVVVITKGGLEMGPNMKGLGRDYLRKACEASLRRLQTDYIDVYMAHRADPETPVAETLEIYRDLIDEGKICYAGCSNYSTAELQEALTAATGGLPRYEIIEPHYNLVDRRIYEDAMETVAQAAGLGVIVYYALASGFLTGKYRRTEDIAGNARHRMLSQYINPHGLTTLSVISQVAAIYGATPAQVALAWLMARPSVTAPIASATSVQQLKELLKATELRLSPEHQAALTATA
jgi:aryl-alcohol dehydrogenase-like predicted oxidoreductase